MGTFWPPLADESYSNWLKLANIGCRTVIWALTAEILRENHVKYVQNKILQPRFTSFCYSRHILPLKWVLISIEEPSRWGILLWVKKSVAVTLSTALNITSEFGRHCPSPLSQEVVENLCGPLNRLVTAQSWPIGQQTCGADIHLVSTYHHSATSPPIYVPLIQLHAQNNTAGSLNRHLNIGMLFI